MKLGSIIAGRYRIERVIGRGAMGVVVQVTDLHYGVALALKLILPHYAASETLRGRFLREAQVMTRLQTEHVAKVYDVGELDDGTLYLAMELLEGQSLEAMLQSGGPLPPGDVVDIVLEALDAIGEAHILGLVHRDLKPANLFLAARSGHTTIVKVLDFGIVKDASGDRLTATGTLPGSPAYMAPEQIAMEERKIDVRADVWALGVTMYELLAGEVPWTGEINQLLTRIRTEAAPRLRARRPDVAPDLERIIERCLAKRPEDRFASANELASALRDLRLRGLVNSEVAYKRGGIATTTVPTQDRRRSPTTKPEPRRPARRGRASANGLLLLAIALSLVLVAGFVLVMQGRLAN